MFCNSLIAGPQGASTALPKHASKERGCTLLQGAWQKQPLVHGLRSPVDARRGLRGPIFGRNGPSCTPHAPTCFPEAPQKGSAGAHERAFLPQAPQIRAPTPTAHPRAAHQPANQTAEETAYLAMIETLRRERPACSPRSCSNSASCLKPQSARVGLMRLPSCLAMLIATLSISSMLCSWRLVTVTTECPLKSRALRRSIVARLFWTA